MNWAKLRWLGGLGLLIVLLLFSHQNCAPASHTATSASSTTANAGIAQPVSIIDDSKTSAAVSFSSPTATVSSSSATIDIQGVCSSEQNDAVLGWQLTAIESDGTAGSVAVKGFATCENSAFTVHLGAPSQITCGTTYELIAQLGFGLPGQTAVVMPCP